MIRGTLILGLSLTVFTVDLVTKLAAPLDTWQWHRDAFSAGPPGWQHVPMILAAVVCAVAFRSFGFAMIATGLMGNVVSQLATGGVPNMIVVTEHGQTWAYNVADAAMMAGGVMAPFEVLMVATATWGVYRARSSDRIPKGTAPVVSRGRKCQSPRTGGRSTWERLPDQPDGATHELPTHGLGHGAAHRQSHA